MRTSLAKLAYAVLACISVAVPLQVNAADDTDGQRAAANADASVPSKSDSADSAFRKLDRGGKGYVTLEDTGVLPDFAMAFMNADSTHLGRLNLVAFTRAWTAYVGGNN